MRFVSSLLAASTVLLCAAVPVSADPSTTSRLSWVTNGDVQAAVQVGNTLYIGGTFTRVAPASGALGSFFGVSTITGEPLPNFPLVNGLVHAIEPDGAGGYFIGGAFTKVGAAARSNLAHVLPGGEVDPNFAPTTGGGPVRSLALGSAGLFIGGSFNLVNNVSRPGFALLNPTTGSAIVLPPPAFAEVSFPRRILIAGANVVTVSPLSSQVLPRVIASDQSTGAAVWSTTLAGTPNDAVIAGSRLIVGGRLLQADRRTLVALDLTTGAIDAAWAPSGSPSATSSDGVNALAVAGTTLYVGGTFSSFGGQPRANAAAVDIPMATVTSWAPDPDGELRAVATSSTGTVLVSGKFRSVGGEARDTFAEVDLSGNVTAFTADVQAALLEAMRVDAGGNIVAGGLASVTNGAPRNNLAAFDLSSNTLAPWAPVANESVTMLAEANGRIFVGTSRFVTDPTPSVLNAVFAVDATTGVPVVWTPPASLINLRLLGAHGSRVYVSADVAGLAFVRLDATTAGLDPGFRPQVATPLAMVVSGETIYLALNDRLASVDLTTGMRSQWSPNLGFTLGSMVSVKSLAVEGRTVYVAYRWRRMAITSHLQSAFDAVTGLPVTFPAGADGAGVEQQLAVADGQVLMSRAFAPDGPFSPAAVTGVQAINIGGGAAAWNPGYVRPELSLSSVSRPGLVVTPTDVIVLGYYGTTPVPVQGIAVLPRNPSASPTTLNATTLDNQVTLAWHASTPPPATEYVVDVAATQGSGLPAPLPTGGVAPTVSGVAGNGTYYVRVRNAGAPGPSSPRSNEIALVVGCSAAPSSPPLGLAAQVTGSTVTLSWTKPPFSTLSRYVLEAGSSAGATNITTLTLPASQTSIGGAIPAGTYFVRLRAENACGASAASSDVFFTIGSASAIPAAPTGLSATANGGVVGVQWTASAGAAGYVLEVGSAPGQSNLGTLPISTTTVAAAGVPNGVYHLRVRAANAAGLSAPSSEFVLVVTQ